jgi:methyltransferase (TIGR00027 family)
VPGDAANADYLAERFLLPFQRRLNRAPRVTRWLLERALPGAFGYFNARTQYFDDVLQHEIGAGIDQLVILGAGFDSRALRFAAGLRSTRVFVVDMPEVLSVRMNRLAGVDVSCVSIPIDFEREQLAQALLTHGCLSDVRTVFLWEGVTYYLRLEQVRSVLSTAASFGAPGSSVLFDYVTLSFFEGDRNSYGASRLADSWRRLGNVNQSGIGDVDAFVRSCGLTLKSDIGAAELERRYLAPLAGGAIRAWGAMRIAHAISITI